MDDLAVVFLDVFDENKRGVDAFIDVGDLADEIKDRPLFARGQCVKITVAVRILVQYFLQLFGHWQAVFAFICRKFDRDLVTGRDAELVAFSFIDDDRKNLAPRNKRALETDLAVDRTDDPPCTVFFLKPFGDLRFDGNEMPAGFDGRFSENCIEFGWFYHSSLFLVPAEHATRIASCSK